MTDCDQRPAFVDPSTSHFLDGGEGFYERIKVVSKSYSEIYDIYFGAGR
jgi:hypothetical protein